MRMTAMTIIMIVSSGDLFFLVLPPEADAAPPSMENTDWPAEFVPLTGELPGALL